MVWWKASGRVHGGHLPVGYSVWNVTIGLARTIYIIYIYGA